MFFSSSRFTFQLPNNHNFRVDIIPPE
jgi:hypothetical protein